MNKVRLCIEFGSEVHDIDFQWIAKTIGRLLEYGETDFDITDPRGNKIGECKKIIT